jgi:serine/threonine protein kinase
MSHHNQNNSNSYIYEVSRSRDNGNQYRQYQKGKHLGEGGFAVVHKVTRIHDGKELAMKIIKLSDKKAFSATKEQHRSHKHNKPSTEEKAYMESKLLKTCQHEHVVKYETHFMYEGEFYLIM